MKYCLLFFVCVLLARTALAQELEGKVENSNGMPLEGATVTLSAVTDSSFTKILFSDKNGRFRFVRLPPGNYCIRVTHVGYQPFVVPAVTVQRQPVYLPAARLNSTDQVLEKIVVNTTGKHFIEQQVDRTVINVQALASNAGSTAADVLNNTPGVTMNEDGTFSLKGKEGALVYIDDKPTYLSGTELLAYLRSLPAAMLDKIELMSNPPARFNAAGSAGIIHIKTKKQKTPGLNSQVSLSYGRGRYDRTVNNMLLNFKQGKLNFYGNLGYSSINNYYTVTRNRNYHYPDAATGYTLQQDFLETNHTRNVSYKTGIDYDINSASSLGILLQGSTSPYKEQGHYVNLFQNTAGGIDSSMHSLSRMQSNACRYGVDLYFRRRLAASGEISVTFDYLSFRDRREQALESQTYLPSGEPVNPYALLSQNPSTAHIYSARADYSGTTLWQLNLETGAQAIVSRRYNQGNYFNATGGVPVPDETLTNTFRYRENINAVYINLRKRLRRLTVQTGFRVESTAGKVSLFTQPAKADSSFTLSYLNAFPTAYISYQLDSAGQQSVTLSAGKRIGRPNYQDLNPSLFFFDRNTAITGNQLLQPGFTTNLELTYSYRQLLLLGVTYSNSRQDINTAFMQQDDRLVTTIANYDRVTSLGLNASLMLSLTRWLSVNWYQELTRSHFKSKLFSGEESVNNSLTGYRSSLVTQIKAAKGWSGDLSFNYRSKVVVGQAFLGSLVQLHAGLQKKVNDRLTVTFTARDLLHTWRLQRDIRIRYAQIYSLNQSGTQQLAATLVYRLGTQAGIRERKTGVQAEAGRL